ITTKLQNLKITQESKPSLIPYGPMAAKSCDHTLLKVAVWTTSERKKPAQSCFLEQSEGKKPAQSCFLEQSEGKKPAPSCCLDHFRRKETRSKLLSGPLQKKRNPLKVAVWTTSEEKKPAQSCCLDHFRKKDTRPLEGILPAQSGIQEPPWKESNPHEVEDCKNLEALSVVVSNVVQRFMGFLLLIKYLWA
ncbi:3853_t:CDS:2, partial [Dentiscutata erythropus]